MNKRTEAQICKLAEILWKNWYVAETLRTNLQTLENTVRNAMLQKLSCIPLKIPWKTTETFLQTSKNTMKNAELQKKYFFENRLEAVYLIPLFSWRSITRKNDTHIILDMNQRFILSSPPFHVRP